MCIRSTLFRKFRPLCGPESIHVSNTCVKDLIFVALKASQWSISVATFVNINFTWKSFIKSTPGSFLILDLLNLLY